MVWHKFKIGDTVELRPERLDRTTPSGRYTVERLLPVEQGVPQYRVKHKNDGHQRVVTESQLAVLSPGTGNR